MFFDQPVSHVRWVPIEKVVANDYNPNRVAKNEMHLLYISILHDGYTQPVVTIYDENSDKYVIVDGFHRYLVMKEYPDIARRTQNHLPVVVIHKSLNERIAATVRHNRARGKHSVHGMANLVFKLLDNGWGDEEICNELGLSADELARLKYVTGFAKLFENVEYQRAWVTRNQIRIKKQYENTNSADRTDKTVLGKPAQK